jgi:uncharacterized damage-inducible protein DinB
MRQEITYPIGKFEAPKDYTAELRSKLIGVLAAQPAALRAAVAGLSPAQLDTPYRHCGWTLRQVTHHVADSHANAYVRTRLALTEDNPTIKPYAEARWAELADARTMPVEVSLAIFEGLHDRWTTLLRSLTPEQWARPFVHPEAGNLTVNWLLAQYAWHGSHHTAQITSLRAQEGW